MAIAEIQGKNVPIKLWTVLDEVETAARQQLENIAALPWVFKQVAVMPDVHYGKGATVGSVIAMKDAVCPAAVGVDIGCGMAAIRTNLTAKQLPDSLKKIRSKLEAAIPVGFDSHKKSIVDSVLGRHKDFKKIRRFFREFHQLDAGVHKLEGRMMQQVGTLGGGNHFIELCLDTHDTVWMMLHSGSRNIGKTLADIHIGRAKKLIHNAELPDKDLAVFLADTKEMADYRRDLNWAQEYALINREAMLEIYMSVLTRFFPGFRIQEKIQCHHNYVSEEIHFGEDVLVTRKGAIHAGVGEKGIIPGSMGARSFIVEGLGHPDAFCSASHGAGRRMSRNQAKRRFNVEDLEKQTSGIECRKDEKVLDEIPAAYKDIDIVMNNQRDLVKVLYELRQILCVKG